MENKWEDCEELCPGTDFTCNENFLFNMEGVCVNGTDARDLLRKAQSGPLAAVLDDIPSETSQRPAPVCPVGEVVPLTMQRVIVPPVFIESTVAPCLYLAVNAADLFLSNTTAKRTRAQLGV